MSNIKESIFRIRKYGITLQQVLNDLCEHTGSTELDILPVLSELFSTFREYPLIALPEDTGLDSEVQSSTNEISPELYAIYEEQQSSEHNAYPFESYVITNDSNDRYSEHEFPLGLYRIDLDNIINFLELYKYPTPRSWSTIEGHSGHYSPSQESRTSPPIEPHPTIISRKGIKTLFPKYTGWNKAFANNNSLKKARIDEPDKKLAYYDLDKVIDWIIKEGAGGYTPAEIKNIIAGELEANENSPTTEWGYRK